MLTIQNILITFFTIGMIIKHFIRKKQRKSDKKYFVDILNHNLRICLLAQTHGINLLLKEGAKTDLQKELFSTLSASNKYNLEMVTTMLDSYKFENNEQNIQAEVFDIDSLIWFCNNEISELLKDKNIKIVHNYTNHHLFADKNYVQKLIDNLVYIALIHSYKNTETIITITSDNKNLKFCITYDGGNLSKNLDITSDYMAVGCGIKMHYCKKITDFYKGQIKLADTKNGKHSLVMTLPIICQNLKKVS